MFPVGQPLGHGSVASGELLDVGKRLGVRESPGGFQSLHGVDRSSGERRRHGVEQILGGAAFEFVDHAEDGDGLSFGHAEAGEVTEPERTVGDADAEVLLRQAEAEQAVGAEGDDLGVRRGAGFAEKVGVKLVERTETALLGLFVAVVLADREPADRLRHAVGLGADHTGQRRGHLRT